MANGGNVDPKPKVPSSKDGATTNSAVSGTDASAQARRRQRHRRIAPIWSAAGARGGRRRGQRTAQHPFGGVTEGELHPQCVRAGDHSAGTPSPVLPGHVIARRYEVRTSRGRRHGHRVPLSRQDDRSPGGPEARHPAREQARQRLHDVVLQGGPRPGHTGSPVHRARARLRPVRGRHAVPGHGSGRRYVAARSYQVPISSS